MTERKMPPLGPGSIDADALHAADQRGDDLHEAIEKARVEPQPPPDLDKMLKGDLIAEAEGLGLSLPKNATADDIRKAIETHRSGVPGEPLGGPEPGPGDDAEG